jgi:hypothetical protein
MDHRDLQRLLAEHEKELKRFRVRTLSVFGSVARGQASVTSDVDLLVDFDNAPGFDQYMDLKFFLEDLLHRRVDLVTPAALKARIRPAVEREAIRVA